MPEISRGTAVLAAVLIGGLIAAAALDRHAGQSPAPSTYVSSDTSPDGYGAFAQLLARESIRTETFEQRPAALDESIDTLIIAATTDADLSRAARPSALDADDLREWVARGHRTILIDSGGTSSDEEMRSLGRPELAVAAKAAPRPNTFSGALAAGIHHLAIRGTRYRARTGRVLLADASGPIVVARGIGNGEVWYVVSGVPFKNAEIGREDNARLAYALARPLHRGGVVAFDEAVHGMLVETSWWSLLPIWLRIALSGACIAALLALAGGALRLGPPLPVRRLEPTTADFLDAVARLYEHAKIVPDGG